MLSFETYKNLVILSTTPIGTGGQALNQNFSYIADALEAIGVFSDDLATKANMVSSPTTGHLASLTNTGDLADSGYAAASFDASGAAATVNTALTTHEALTGTAVHGLGTASTHAHTDYDASGAAATVNTALTTHAALTAAHGTTGNIVGDSDTQTLTNKTIDYDNNTILNLPSGSAGSATTVQVSDGSGGFSAAPATIDNSGNLTLGGGLHLTADEGGILLQGNPIWLDSPPSKNVGFASPNFIFNFAPDGTTPGNTSTPVTWWSVTMSGTTYQIPLYQ